MAEYKAKSKEVLKVSDLDRILRHTVVKKESAKWKDIGYELDLTNSSLAKIRHDKEEDCMRDMLRVWLITSDNPTLEHLLEAIDRMNKRHARKRHREEAESDSKRIRHAIREIEIFVDNWEIRDRALRDDNLTTLVNDLKKEEKWMTTAKQWDKESTEWKTGETAKKRASIREALTSKTNFINDAFVNEFLQNKDFTNPSKLKDQMIEGMLRQALAEIDVNRVRALSVRYMTTKNHQQQLTNLKTEISQLKATLDNRLASYTENTVRLDNIGAKVGEGKRNILLQNLRDLVKECNAANEQCCRICMDGDNFEANLKHDLEEHKSSLRTNIEEMVEKKLEFTEMMLVSDRSIGPAAFVGAVAGGAAGTAALPVIGTTLGAVAGTVAGATLGFMSRFVSPSAPPALLKKELDNYIETLEKAKIEQIKLKKLIDD